MTNPATSADWNDRPELVGDHVRLVPLSTDHAVGLFEALGSDDVLQHFPIRTPSTVEETRSMVDAVLSQAPAQLAWAQVDQASGRLAGATTFYDISEAQRTVAIGWTWLGRAFWRTGINTESKLLLLSRAFDDLGCVRVVWHTDQRNDRSQQAILRLGATFEGSLRKHKQRPDGSWRDTFTYSLLDDEWPAARARLEQRLRPPDRDSPPNQHRD